MRRLSPVAKALAIALIVAIFGPALAVVDQENSIQPNYLSIQPNSDQRWQQQVIPGIGGKLVGIELFYKQDAPWLGEDLAFEFFINRGVGWQTDADDYSTMVIANTTNIFIDVSAADLTFQPDERFIFGVTRAATATASLCCSLFATVNSYSGDLWSEYSNSVHTMQSDFAFRTHVNALPEPASWVLALAALLASGFSIQTVTKRRTTIETNSAP